MDKPEAMRLADLLVTPYAECNVEAAAELRRLHAECNDLAHQLNESNERNGRIVAQRDAMQERAEYWKRKHDEEETGAERYALRVQRDALLEALRAFVSCALPVSRDIDERGHSWTEAYLDQALPIARATIKAVEEGK